MRLLVDTSAYSAFMRGHSAIKSSLQRADEIVVNAIVLGELAAGFIKGGAAETRKSSADFSAHRGSMLST